MGKVRFTILCAFLYATVLVLLKVKVAKIKCRIECTAVTFEGYLDCWILSHDFHFQIKFLYVALKMPRVFSWEYFSFLQIDDTVMSKVFYVTNVIWNLDP